MAMPTKEGPLYKYRNLLRGWEYRYFKLSRDYLHYYDAQHAPSPRKSLIRTNILSVTVCTAFPGKEHCFQVDARPSEKWFMQATSESDMRSWIAALTAHLPPSHTVEEKSAKELEAEESEDVVPLPPIPQYMKDSMSSSEPPPSYDQCVEPDDQTH